jgi:AcrR family transcriptional regulator
VALRSPDGSPAVADGRRGELIRIAGAVFSDAGYARTSLRDVAEAAGILTGSLYHHFPSKEALAIELISAFHAEIDAVAFEPGLSAGDPLGDLAEFADKVGQVAVRHRAAVTMCMYDPPSTATEALTSLVRRELVSLDNRWAVLVDAARDVGLLRRDLDLAMLRTVLRTVVFHLSRLPGAGSVRDLIRALSALLLHGISVGSPAPEELDASAPTRVVREIVESWSDPAGTGRREQIVEAARIEFARRGYEATTVRDVAQAGEIRPSSLYRHFASKQQILDAIMERFSRHLLVGFEAVAAAPGSAVERLDALMRLMASAAGRFRPEFAIVKDWWRTLEPAGVEVPPVDNTARLRLLEGVVNDGIETGQFVRPPDAALLTLALRGLLWIPIGDPDPAAVARRHAFLRLCVLDGAAADR